MGVDVYKRQPPTMMPKKPKNQPKKRKISRSKVAASTKATVTKEATTVMAKTINTGAEIKPADTAARCV